jgi:hypothetical protein
MGHIRQARRTTGAATATVAALSITTITLATTTFTTAASKCLGAGSLGVENAFLFRAIFTLKTIDSPR